MAIANRPFFLDFATDKQGNVLGGVSVEVRQPGTTNKVTGNIYLDDNVGSAPAANPFTAGDDGLVFFTMDTSTRVDLYLTAPGQDPRTLPAVALQLQASTFGVRDGNTPAAMPQRATLNFSGDTVALSDDAGNNRTNVAVNHPAAAVHSAAQPPQGHTHAFHSGIGPNDHHNQAHPDTDHTGPNRSDVAHNAALVGTRPRLDLVDASDGSITLAVADDVGNNKVTARPVLTFGTGPTAETVGATASDGALNTVARMDHRHALAAPGAAYAQNVAAAEVDGVATTPARSDHIHAHGTGYLPDAHHPQVHKPDQHTFVGCKVFLNAGVNVLGDGTPKDIPWDSADFVTDAIETGLPVTSLTLPFAGKWLLLTQIAWPSAGSGTQHRDIIIKKNGSAVANSVFNLAAVGGPVHMAEVIIQAALNDTIKVTVAQTSGGTIQPIQGVDQSFFVVQYLGA